MPGYAITWSKEYHEDIGEEDENGFFDYVYLYFNYCFYLPDGTKIRIRRYTDTIDECTMYFYGADNQCKRQISEELSNYLPSIVAFMLETQEVKRFSYFNGIYKLLELKGINTNSAKFSFLEIIL